MYEKEFARRLTELRLKANVSARNMSLSLGQNEGYINHIENQQNMPSLTGFFNICDYFHITPLEFFNIDNPNPELISKIDAELEQIDDEYLDHIYGILKIMKKKNP